MLATLPNQTQKIFRFTRFTNQSNVRVEEGNLVAMRALRLSDEWKRLEMQHRSHPSPKPLKPSNALALAKKSFSVVSFSSRIHIETVS